jgi:hypothetical protein
MLLLVLLRLLPHGCRRRWRAAARRLAALLPVSRRQCLFACAPCAASVSGEWQVVTSARALARAGSVRKQRAPDARPGLRAQAQWLLREQSTTHLLPAPPAPQGTAAPFSARAAPTTGRTAHGGAGACVASGGAADGSAVVNLLHTQVHQQHKPAAATHHRRLGGEAAPVEVALAPSGTSSTSTDSYGRSMRPVSRKAA